MNFHLEICIDSIDSAINAQSAGADRVELCSDLPEGGTTPSIGTIYSVRNNLTIGVNVIIRPRGGDFLYSDQEYDIMRREVDTCGECGVDGIVIGILTANGSIDVDRSARLIELARPMSATFHRAFDMCNDPLKGLEDVIATGANRLLTSGQKDSAADGAQLIGKLVKLAGDRIIIMPGGGLNESNIVKVARETGAKEYHLTGRKIIESDMTFRKQDISMGTVPGLSEFNRKIADPDLLGRVIKNLKMI